MKKKILFHAYYNIIVLYFVTFKVIITKLRIQKKKIIKKTKRTYIHLF